ncbi:hypothetical protein [Dactylosporangium sp. NPDC051541]
MRELRASDVVGDGARAEVSLSAISAQAEALLGVVSAPDVAARCNPGGAA